MTSDRPQRPGWYEARERRRAAIHEAGHAVVARHLGIEPFDVRVWRWEAPAPDERTWGGQVRFSSPISRHERQLIIVAGAVALAAWDRCETHYEVEDYLDELSESDRAGFDDDDLLAPMRDTFALLRRDGPLWPRLVEQTRELILAARQASGASS